MAAGGRAAFDVAVVGGGPAGMMAAIAAAERGARVVLLERLPDLGRKLRATGGGRCNLTNTRDRNVFLAAFGAKRRFVRPAIAAFDGEALRAFLVRRGVPTESPDGVHVFPASGRARSVADALEALLAERGVRVCAGTAVTRIETADGCVRGVGAAAAGWEARAVVLAGGGPSCPDLGGTDAGFGLAAALGHRLVPPVPALAGIAVAEAWVGECAGIVLPEVEIAVAAPGGARRRGQMLFTHRGLSGPAALDLSGDVAAALRGRGAVPLAVDLTPGTSRAAWERRCEEWREMAGRKRVRTLLGAVLPRALAERLAAAAGLDRDAACAHLPRARRARLADLIAALPLTAVGTDGFEKAMATRGGVALEDVAARTLASRVVRGLFFAGEVLDIDGPCGGYNLQWAFASGRLAGVAAARSSASGGVPSP